MLVLGRLHVLGWLTLIREKIGNKKIFFLKCWHGIINATSAPHQSGVPKIYSLPALGRVQIFPNECIACFSHRFKTADNSDSCFWFARSLSHPSLGHKSADSSKRDSDSQELSHRSTGGVAADFSKLVEFESSPLFPFFLSHLSRVLNKLGFSKFIGSTN